MAFPAIEAIIAALIVVTDKIFRLPVGTRFRVVAIHIRPPPEVLPVVGIHTECLVVTGEVERTPYSLVVKDVEVGIVNVVVNEVGVYFVFCMSKRAKIAIIAFNALVEKACAELGLVLIFTVQLLYSVMGILTFVSNRTVLCLP